MKILCIMDKYYPDSSANMICGNNIMNFFKNKGYLVDFLVLKETFDSQEFINIEGSNVIRIGTYTDKYLKKFSKSAWQIKCYLL